MNVGILTLPLHTNYGGILQAYALQYSLRNMGHEPYLVDWRVDPKYANIVKRPAASVFKALAFVVPPLSKILAPLERQMRADKVVMHQHTEAFIKKYISIRHFSSYKSIPKSAFDAIVVGSDQVWRPEYFIKPIDVAFLSFAREWSVKRVAYAASFGVDSWEYSPEQSRKCRALISLFDAVSVREDSGVELCRRELLRESSLVVDPTLLVPKEHYVEIAERAQTPKAEGNLMVSFLDSDIDKYALMDSLSEYYAVKPFGVNSKVEDRTAPLEQRIQPPVETWLRGFIDADYVVTDSYHSSLFAIIFNKPFVVYGNQDRGYTRFLSLLSRLGLEAQFVTKSSEVNLEQCFNIDWLTVNQKLDSLRAESLGFLRSALG